jgi:hypothetical protein
MSTGWKLEEDVAKWLRSALKRRILGLDPDLAKVRRPFTAYSPDRDREIKFDVAIEVFLEGGTRPFSLWLWECKDYSDRVRVSQVEVFNSQINQIGSAKTKGTMVSTAGFEKATLNFADTHGITLIRIVRRPVPSTDEIERLFDRFPGNRDAWIVRELGPMQNRSASGNILTADDILQGAYPAEPCFITRLPNSTSQSHPTWDHIAESLR